MEQRNYPLGPFLLGVVAVFFSGRSMAQENTNWKDRFYAEAPKRWEEYRRFAKSLQMNQKRTRHLLNVKGDGKESKEVAQLEFKQTKEACLLVFQRFEPEFTGQVEGLNPSYSFDLIRRSPDKGWIIKNMVASDQSPAFSDERRKFEEEPRFFWLSACRCLCLGPHVLPEVMNDPAFKVTEVKPQGIDGQPLVRIDFDYPSPSKPGLCIRGWMALDPDHDWILREYEIYRGPPPEIFMHFTYQIREGTDRHPMMTRQTWQWNSKGERKWEERGEAEWQVVENSDVPLEEFTLSAFGLPEPPGIPVQRSRLHLWIALGGILCICIAALIRWQARRARAAG